MLDLRKCFFCFFWCGPFGFDGSEFWGVILGFFVSLSFSLSLSRFLFFFFFQFFSFFFWCVFSLDIQEALCVCITKLFCLFVSFHDFSLLSSSGIPLPDFRGLEFFFGLVHK